MTDTPVFGLLRAPWDAHSLGVSRVVHMIRDSGLRAFLADDRVLDGMDHLSTASNEEALVDWVRANHISHLGLTYRLEPDDGVALFGQVHSALRNAGLTGDRGQIRQLFFAGLPAACERIAEEFGPGVITFDGEESPAQTARLLGLPVDLSELEVEDPYDTQRNALAGDLVRSGKVMAQALPERPAYPECATATDGLVRRLAAGRRGDLPLLRTHVGPYDADPRAAIATLHLWLRELADDGLVDIASIATSQLTQERFGQNWDGLPNSGGVPLNSPEEFEQLWRVSRPMLLRTYAGTTRMRELAAMYEQSIHIAWHALSLWWFCETDGRGPLSLAENLAEHVATISDIARYGTPFEANVPHHFSFRGADDVTYVVSAYLSALLAKQLGVSTYVLQIMLNTPAVLSGTTDLARARAVCSLVRRLEDASFRVVLQPRAGLDYFSTDEDLARVQLASVTMLMDDIEASVRSPQVIHVVNYSEARSLADPAVIKESARIVLGSLQAYRRQRSKVGRLYDPDAVRAHRDLLVRQARDVIAIIEQEFPGPLTATSLFRIFEAGFLPVPDLVGGRDKYPRAICWPTHAGPEGVVTVAPDGAVVDPRERALWAADRLRAS